MIPDNGSVYLDNHATTRVDPDVVQSMVPWFTDNYGNAGSGTHAMGTQAREAVEVARQRVAQVVVRHLERLFLPVELQKVSIWRWLVL